MRPAPAKPPPAAKWETSTPSAKAQAARLRRLSAETGKSIAALIREALDGYVEEPGRAARWERALSVVGKYRSDGASVADDHDRHLDAIYGDH